MDISVEFNLDDGFLRRECPNCERQFKWHHGPMDDRPDDAVDPPQYTCPYCGEPGANDAWWTPEQLDYIMEAAQGPAMEMIADELERGFKRSKHITFEKGSIDVPALPPPPAEPGDMTGVASPCHPWEPIKIAESWDQPIHCIVCGRTFVA